MEGEVGDEVILGGNVGIVWRVEVRVDDVVVFDWDESGMGMCVGKGVWVGKSVFVELIVVFWRERVFF
ncbi:hypothetical protein, partial [Cytobacillus oceanisediminis]|uniref:hypothetical protein n=1 Tax=Cytobacillus oceanisediminis TaxID=665099 RepID=UPI0011A49F30